MHGWRTTWLGQHPRQRNDRRLLLVYFLFPHKEGSTYLLPIKAEIRKKQALEVDKIAHVILSIKIA
jgi:hypothetical protein